MLAVDSNFNDMKYLSSIVYATALPNCAIAAAAH